MDSLRGEFGEAAGLGDSYDPADDDVGAELPPVAIGADERRMQVRAYNHWASLLGNRAMPDIADLATGSLPDFDPYSVLLDFSTGLEDPSIRFLGSALAAECDADPQTIRSLHDVPGRSLLSRITDHYLQIHANQAPIGFEAEFVNQQGRTILYRGILLPFAASAERQEIDLIYGVINWKELADQQTTDALMNEIDRALDFRSLRDDAPMAEWADGPADNAADILELVNPLDEADHDFDWPEPVFGEAGFGEAGFGGAGLEEEARSLADWLASARELAHAAQGSEDRSRQALYAAIGRAWDFALAAHDAPEEFQELLEDAGLTMQERAPFTPVVKLVFGAEYDKTRLTEYASAMAHAQRHAIGRGEMAAFLAQAAGGLKGVVNAERRQKREESGKTGRLRDTPREALSKKLRALPTLPLAELAAEGEEFSLLVVRRTGEGGIQVVGEVGEDIALLEKAAKSLLG